MSKSCINKLTLVGVVDAVQSLKAAMCENTNQLISAEKFCPIPLELRTDDLVGGWSDGRLQNWGAIWELGEFDKTYDQWMASTETQITFEAAWNPPVALFKFVSLLHPEVVLFLQYTEPMLEATGNLVIFRGVVTEVELIADESYEPLVDLSDSDSD